MDPMMTIAHHRDMLSRLDACGESLDWLGSLPTDTTSETAWTLCPRGDWLIWLLATLHRRSVIARSTLVLAGCAAARTALMHLAGTPWESACREAIDVTERWCRGDATIDEVRMARQAAWQARRAAADAAAYAAYAAAAYAAYAAYAAAAYAADDAYAADAAAAYAAYAAYAAAAAYAYAAADDAYAAYAAAAYAAAYARATRRQEIADAVRAVVPWATIEAAVREVA